MDSTYTDKTRNSSEGKNTQHKKNVAFVVQYLFAVVLFKLCSDYIALHIIYPLLRLLTSFRVDHQHTRSVVVIS